MEAGAEFRLGAFTYPHSRYRFITRKLPNARSIHSEPDRSTGATECSIPTDDGRVDAIDERTRAFGTQYRVFGRRIR